MIWVIDVISWLSLLAGGFFLLVGSLGMVRLPDFWARLHAASVIDSAGIGLLILGMALQAGFTLVTIKLFLIVLFLLVTGPTATHAIANAAYVSGSRPQGMKVDETLKSTKKKAPRKKPSKQKAKN